MTDCPGACNAAYRRAITANTADPGQPNPGDPYWCAWDTARIRRQLAELDDLAALHAMRADGHREPTTEPVRGNVHPPSPSPIADDALELVKFLSDWEDAYRELPGHQWMSAKPRRGYLADVRTTIVAWLLDHLGGVLEAPFAEDFGREVGSWHRTLCAKAKAGTGSHWMPGPCPWCGWRTLFKDEGDDHVACHNPGPPRCRARLTMDEYQREAARAAS